MKKIITINILLLAFSFFALLVALYLGADIVSNESVVTEGLNTIQAAGPERRHQAIAFILTAAESRLDRAEFVLQLAIWLGIAGIAGAGANSAYLYKHRATLK